MDFANSINTPLDIETLKVVSQDIDNKGEITINLLSSKGQNFVISAENPRQNPMGEHQRVIRHLSIFDEAVYLRITPNRPSCGGCDHHSTTTGKYHWLFFNFLQDRRRAPISPQLCVSLRE